MPIASSSRNGIRPPLNSSFRGARDPSAVRCIRRTSRPATAGRGPTAGDVDTKYSGPESGDGRKQRPVSVYRFPSAIASFPTGVDSASMCQSCIQGSGRGTGRAAAAQSARPKTAANTPQVTRPMIKNVIIHSSPSRAYSVSQFCSFPAICKRDLC